MPPIASTLVVPIDLEALCVGSPDVANGASTLAPLADFSVLPYLEGNRPINSGPYVSARVLAGGAPLAGQVPLVRGIHLHWALPRGLTHGLQPDDPSLPIQFPHVPNRWLLTRIIADGKDPAQARAVLRSWVIESDRLTLARTALPGIAQPTVPLAATTVGQSFRYLGQSFDLVGWVEQGLRVERLSPLTAMGYGEAAFAAYHPSSSTVFGFVDTFEGTSFNPATSVVAYQVSGWYTAPAVDPLSQQDIDPANNPFDWTFTPGRSPKQTVLSGLVHGIAWNPGRPFLGGGARPLKVAVAGSPQEALSALMASGLSGPAAENAEPLLNAVQFGLLSDSGQLAGSLQAFEEEVHAAGFASLAGGTLWSIEEKDTGQTASDSKDLPAQSTLPAPLARQLHVLNSLQLQLDGRRQQMLDQQGQLFADWYKSLLAEYSPSDVPERLRGQTEAIRGFLRTSLRAIRTTADRATQVQDAIENSAAAIRGMLGDLYELTADTSAPRYWRPNDPVLALAGEDLIPTRRFGSDGAGGRDGLLPCRLDGELVTGVSVTPRPADRDGGGAGGRGPTALTLDGLLELSAQPAGLPVVLLTTLVRESFLLAPTLLPAFVTIGRRGARGGGQILLALQQALPQFLAGKPPNNVQYSAKAKAPAPIMLNAWTGTPRLPLLLQYEIGFQPVQAGGPLQLDAESIELRYSNNALGAEERSTGSVILSPLASADLAQALQSFLDQTGSPDPELEQTLALVRNMNQLSQGLTGAVQRLLMLRQSLQLEIADPLARIPQPLVTGVRQAVGGQNILAPETTGGFHPIRAGGLTIKRLRLVDVFGRFQDYPAPAAAVARGLAPPPGLSLPPGQAFLPPRLAQPARLRFRWLSAADGSVETNSHPDSSPIQGWVLPNLLDRSLFLYGPDGAVLGELALSEGRDRVLFIPAPGGVHPPGTPLGTVVAGQSATLRGLATGLHNGGDPSVFAPFLQAVSQTLPLTRPAASAQGQGLAALIGRPLALARATLMLDLMGEPSPEQSLESFAGAVLDGAAPGTGGVTGVEFPVKLGAPTQLNDGLVGYWIEPPGSPGLGSFLSPATTTSLRTGRAVTVTLLLDPHGAVHATTGILPTKSISIPPAQYAEALNALSLTFLTTPVLSSSNADDLSIALPRETAGTFSFVTVTRGGQWRTQPVTDVTAETDASLDYTPQQIIEGWLRLTDFEPKP